jgi:TolA-binding protein
MAGELDFLDAVSSAELTNEDSPREISNFVEDYPENALKSEASFYLGKIYFRDNKFKDAIQTLQDVEASGLDRESREQLNFMLGYAQLKSGNTAAAKGHFQRITNQKSPYYGQAKYFLGHIDYIQGNYEQALKTFEQLENDRRYQKVIPIYKIQIYHYLGDGPKIMEIGPAMLESSATTNKAEVARITANAFFNAGDFEKAAYYMDIFERTSRNSLTREDQYLLGYIGYLAGDYKGAINNFQNAIRQNDALSQNAYYYLGVCYNETGQKKYAGNAFLSAYKAGFDPEIGVEALFNYIKISLETPFNPYNEAIMLLEDYLRENPQSPRADEGYGYLSQLYLSSRNYKQALTSMESIGNRNPQLDRAYQKILYYRAGELFNANEMNEALDLYKKSSQLNYDETIRAEALYWAGEISYRQGNYPAAVKYFKDFLNSKHSKSLPVYSNAFYNLGYAYFNSEQYADAITQFSKFMESGQGTDRSLVSDAYLRMGDACFITNQYDRAISYYEKVIASREGATDYALYYKALSEGAKGDFSGKAEVLTVLIKNYPKSGYVDDALFELAMAYVLRNQENQALTWFDRLIKDFPNSTKATQAWLRKGFIYYNRDDNTQAISAFKYIIEKHPGTQESREALAALKNIYVETGNVEEYYSYARGLSFAAVDATEEDSLNYQAAENLYIQARYEQSAAAFRKYIDNFPSGAYVTDAVYYEAECSMKSRNTSAALEGYKKVAERPRSKFTEPALAKAASIEYSAGNFAAALPLFEQLETVAEDPDNLRAALTGQMRCHLREKNYPSAGIAARKLLGQEGVPKDVANESHFALGHSYLSEDNLTEAAAEFRKLVSLKGTEIGADASYQLAWIAFQTDKLVEAEEQAYALAENYPAFDYWVAKGFILLSDVFIKNGNAFQAKETLQSVIDNYSGPELGEIARQKLAALGSN